MENIHNKKIQNIEKKIKILNGLLIVGIIISIIGVFGLITTMIRIGELQQELDKQQSDMQRLSEIDQELDEIQNNNWIFGISLFMGSPIFIMAFDFKRRFSKLKESYLELNKKDSELSFIIDLKEE